ncbi:hypothetical protein AIOGIFDO_01851 [Candidatus Methanoperedenaceae archaeon GB37]|nr:hypothetical protein AIOGIFDO_01851 [Candidatus Methanoperedenaceae archaeon GB37]
MVKLKNLDARQYFAVLIAITVLADLAILLNIPFLRQMLGFLCFTIIPGLLILHILKLNKIEFLKKFVLSIGLSVSFLMFAGLFVNSFYPLILKPLSLEPILISFNVILLILAFIAYKRNKNDFDINYVFNFKLDLKGKLTSPLIFPILFPFMAVFGTYLMNTQGNNIILLTMLFLIPAYVVALVYLGDRIPDATYPVAVWMISIALLFMLSLRTHHIMGGDIHREYFVFQLALNNFHWDISNYCSPYNACLSITILPTIYQLLLNLNSEYVYKFLYQILISFTSLSLYILFKKYLGETGAFLSSLLYIFSFQFIYSLTLIRTPFALFFFALSMVILLDSKTDKLNKKIIFLIFMVSTIVSHYSTGYIFFGLILFSLLITTLIKNIGSIKFEKSLTPTAVILSFAIIFLWYGQITETSFNHLVSFVENTFISLNRIFVMEMYHPAEQRAFGAGLSGIPDWINLIIYYITLVFIGIGVVDLSRKYKTSNFGIEYLSMVFVCAAFLASMVAIPYFSVGYGPDRILLQMLVILAPAFVIGGNIVFKFLRPKLRILLIVIVLLSFLMVNLGVVYQAFGVPHSIIFNSEGFQYDSMCVHDQEIMAAKWLKDNNKEYRSIVYTDRYGSERLLGRGIRESNGRFFKNNRTIRSGYIFLRYYNVIDEKIVTMWKDTHNISEYSHLFTRKSRIYNNGGAEVWK